MKAEVPSNDYDVEGGEELSSKYLRVASLGRVGCWFGDYCC